MKTLSNIGIFLFLTILFLTYGCKENEDRVPYKPVDFYIYINDPQFTELQNEYNPVMVTGGVVGIIIYKKAPGEYVALERNCTYKPSDRCAVSPDSTGLFLICPCCNSKFTLPSDGFVQKGPADRPLVQYSTDFDGDKIHVYN
ncbi:MAG: Rieske 2Fe-2S domain-containing protein [Bacteroidota bacterium]